MVELVNCPKLDRTGISVQASYNQYVEYSFCGSTLLLPFFDLCNPTQKIDFFSIFMANNLKLTYLSLQSQIAYMFGIRLMSKKHASRADFGSQFTINLTSNALINTHKCKFPFLGLTYVLL